MKILNKLTLKNLKFNKSRTVVTIIGILLSTALITVVAGMVSSTQQTLINAEINTEGDYDLSLLGADSSDVQTIKSNRNVKDVYVKDFLGCAYLPDAKNGSKPYINVNALSAKAFTGCFNTTLQEGRYPQNNNEIVVTQEILKNSDRKFAVGDTISLRLGDRTDDQGNVIPVDQTYGIYDPETGESSEEIFIPKQTKTYKIVGILNDCASSQIIALDGAACSTALTLADDNFSENATVYVDYTPESEKDYIKVTSQITGLPEDSVEEYINNYYEAPDLAFENEFKANCKYDDFNVNTSLLKFKGYGLGDDTMQMLYSLAAFIILIIIIASIFVIRNSFAISITEKTKLYGMLSSVGATSKQIRRNVLFEGFILGVIGIPLGLLLGVGVIALLIIILNVLLAENLNGISFVYSVPVLPMVLAVVLSALTILLSTLTTAFRASKIAPITAIRSNKDVKMGKKKKNYRSPKFIKRFFGVGGDIAYKNLKRSRKKYLTTVISIIVSVALFIAMSAVMEYGSKYTAEFYEQMDYNIFITVSGDNTNEENVKKEFAEIEKLSGIKSSAKENLTHDSTITEVNLSDAAEQSGTYEDENGKTGLDAMIFSVDDALYKKTVKALGYDYNTVKDTGILFNYFAWNDKNGKPNVDKLTDYEEGDVVEISFYSGSPSQKIKIGGTVKDIPDELRNCNVAEGSIMVSDEWYSEHIPFEISTSELMIDAEDADDLEQKINSLEYTDLIVDNYDSYVRQTNAMVLILGIFIYGFIIVISLIGVTNIFNTITTNMKLRSKEFAMLKSIGMTKKEFNRMIRLESVFYGVKSLIIGIPLGLLGGFGIFCAFSTNAAYEYVVPWTAIVICIVFVLAVVWLIMKFSISKVKHQNIIETIRNDNI